MTHPFAAFVKRTGILFSVLVSLAFAGCAIEPITRRPTFTSDFILSEAQANVMGAQAFQQLMREAKLGGTAAENALVLSVAERIAKVTDARMAEEGREPFQWEFKVIDDPKTANAFALPGGKVAVYTGILPFTKDANGLAVVLGHEIGHAYAEHGKQRVTQQLLSKVTLESVQMALGGEQASDTAKLAVAALGVGYQVGVELPFSREDESSADEIGLTLMAEAGYDPRGAVAFWQRMSAAGGGGTMEFLSTHPSGETRIRDIEKLLPKAVAIYEKTGGAAPR